MRLEFSINMICSVLIPSRERPNGLKRAVGSVFDTAKHPEKVEVMVRLDRDDPHLGESVQNIAGFANVRIVIGPRWHGYRSLGDFCTEMSRIACGKWVAIMDDDAYYLQEGTPWDEQLEQIKAHRAYCQPAHYWLGSTPYGEGETGPVGVMVPNLCWREWGNDRISFPQDDFLFTGSKKHGYARHILKGLTYRHEWRHEPTKQP